MKPSFIASAIAAAALVSIIGTATAQPGGNANTGNSNAPMSPAGANTGMPAQGTGASSGSTGTTGMTGSTGSSARTGSTMNFSSGSAMNKSGTGKTKRRARADRN